MQVSLDINDILKPKLSKKCQLMVKNLIWIN